jgi:hypothetical protein
MSAIDGEIEIEKNLRVYWNMNDAKIDIEGQREKFEI